MHDVIYRPVPVAVRIVAILTVLTSTALLILGGQTTTLGAGMTDPQFPTSPMHLVDHPEILAGNNHGLKIEHLHRALGFTTGSLASLMALLAWWSEPKKSVRWVGLLAVLVLIAVYGQFYQEMKAVSVARVEGVVLPFPKGWAIASGVCALGVLLMSAVTTARRGGAVRAAVSVALVAVMIQGLLGGFRVLLNQLMGTQLAAIHGTFGQLVFCLLVAVVVLSAPRRRGDTIPVDDLDRIGRWALIVPTVLFLQLVWGAWLRHTGSPVAQRLHVLTAFLATGLILWTVVRAVGTPTGRKHLGFLAYHLLGILAVQVMLGVEAWMVKFAASGPQASVPPQFRAVTTGTAAVRTAHVLIGASLLAAAVVFAMRVWRRPVAAEEPAESTTPESRRGAVNEPTAVA